jgi:hypothetical protein
MEVATFAPIYHSLIALGVDARMVAVPGDQNRAGKGWFDFGNAIAALDARNITYSLEPDHGSDAAVTTQRSIHLRGYKGRRIRVTYTVGLYRSEELQQTRALGFDAVLVQGSFAQRHISQWIDPSRVIVTGFPKYDDFFLNPPDPSVIRQNLGISPRDKVVAYLPTWEARSSIDAFFHAIEQLADTENVCVLVKPHHCTPRFEPERFERLRQSTHARMLPASFPAADLFAVSDLVMADALSGALGESVLTDPARPILCLCPDLPLLQSQMEPDFTDLCPIVTRPDELLSLVQACFRGGESGAAQLRARSAARERLFAHADGTAAWRSAEAILSVITREPASPRLASSWLPGRWG